MGIEDTIRQIVEEVTRRVVREELGRGASGAPGPTSDSLTTDQAAAVAEVTPKTILAWINEGVGGRKLPAGRRGKRRVVSRADLEAFLAGEARATTKADGILRRIG